MTDTPAEVAEALDARLAVESPMTAFLIYKLHELSPLGFDQRTVNDAIFHLKTLWSRATEAERQLAEARAEIAELDAERARQAGRVFAERVRAEAAETQLAAQRERDGRDAERYRFLRDDPPVELAVRQRTDYDASYGFSYLYLDGDQLDAAIDAALKDRP